MQKKLFNFSQSYQNLPEVFFSKVAPTKVLEPNLVILNDELAQELGLNFSALSKLQQAEVLSGNILPQNAQPIALAYAGHQFGNFVILGDGRAVLLGEHVAPNQKHYDVQFKGSGQTPYSRRGDGRATLSSCLREYLISEAMHALKIPTTRSLSVVKTGEKVLRENLFDGAILTRVASSHIRVGTFQLAAAIHGKKEVAALIDYTIKRHFPEISDVKNKTHELLKIVISRQVDLIINWLRVGFVHGVMNTDNMLVSGETIDFGPCAFVDEYDPQKTFSSIDYYGRYAFENQPIIAQWNLARFAETLLPFLSEDVKKSREIAEEEIDNFRLIYQKKYFEMMGKKLGIEGIEEGDEQLISEFLKCLQEQKLDYTNSFRDLLTEKISANDELEKWQQKWWLRRSKNQTILQSNKLMQETNPVVIPRNHQVEKALNSAVEGDFKSFYDLLAVLKNPYQESADKIYYQLPPTDFEKVTQTFCGT